MDSGAGREPDWVRRWRLEGLSVEAALERFDALPGLTPEALFGAWRGAGLPTGHPLDGLLERYGWRGKRFESREVVHPLVFHPGIEIEPRFMPLGLVLRWPRLVRSGLVRAGFRLVRRAFRARKPGARVAAMEFRGRVSAAMIYDRQPIVDHFRRIDEGRVLGLMEVRGMAPFFFLLTAEG